MSTAWHGPHANHSTRFDCFYDIYNRFHALKQAGCLKKDNCTKATYEVYLNKFAWTFVVSCILVSLFSYIGDLIKCVRFFFSCHFAIAGNVRIIPFSQLLNPLVHFSSLSVRMRHRLNAHLQQRMFRGHMLYRLQLDGRADTFEQRATSDLQALLDGLTCAAFGNTSDHLVHFLSVNIL